MKLLTAAAVLSLLYGLVNLDHDRRENRVKVSVGIVILSVILIIITPIFW
jgi:hypothetical protein